MEAALLPKPKYTQQLALDEAQIYPWPVASLWLMISQKLSLSLGIWWYANTQVGLHNYNAILEAVPPEHPECRAPLEMYADAIQLKHWDFTGVKISISLRLQSRIASRIFNTHQADCTIPSFKIIRSPWTLRTISHHQS